MLSTRRGTKDPLVRALLDNYKFNLLSVPREDCHVYDFYFGKGRDIYPPSRFSGIFKVAPSLPPVSPPADFKVPATNFSDVFEVGVASRLITKIFNCYGTSVSDAKLTAALELQNSAKAKMRFVDVTREATDSLAVHRSLEYAVVRQDMLNILGGKNLYLVVSVVRAKGLEFSVSDENRQELKIEGGAAVEKAVEGEIKGGITVTNSRTGNVVFKGDKSIAFGVELVELSIDEKTGSAGIGDLPPAIDIRDTTAIKPPSLFVGDKEGPIFAAL